MVSILSKFCISKLRFGRESYGWLVVLGYIADGESYGWLVVLGYIADGESYGKSDLALSAP